MPKIFKSGPGVSFYDARFVNLTGDSMTGTLNNTAPYTTDSWMRVGTSTVPANTTSGDLTINRLSFNNRTFSVANGQLIASLGTSTNTASGAVIANGFTHLISPASNSSAQFRALNFSNQIAVGSTVTLNSIQAGVFENRVTGGTTDSNITKMEGIVVSAFTTDSSQPGTPVGTIGSIATIVGITVTPLSRASGTARIAGAGTIVAYDTAGGNDIADDITLYNPIRLVNPGITKINTLVGIDIAALTRGTAGGNIGIRIARPAGSAPNYALQLSGTNLDTNSGITFATDTNLYRSGTNVLKTDDSLTIGGDLDHDGTNVGFYGVAPTARQAIVALTNNTGVAGNDTVENVPAAAGDAGGIAGVSLAINVATVASVNTALTAIENDIADLTDKVNAIITILETIGIAS